MDQNNYIFEVEDLCKYFPAGKKKVVKAVDGINLKIRKGETIGLVGESGCGKTTCGRTIIKLYEPTKGKILFEGKDVSKLHGKELLSFKKGCSGHIPGSVCISGPTYDNRRDY